MKVAFYLVAIFRNNGAFTEFLCVLGIERAPRQPETRASFGVPGAISPLPLSSLGVTAKSLLQKSGLSDQH